jgi:hypothetical protein
MRKTLLQIKYYPRPQELYEQLIKAKGWPYKTEQARFLMRDRALCALLYLGDFRISEVLPLRKSNFKIEKNHVLVFGVQVGKRKKEQIIYREAKLPLEGIRAPFTKLILDYLEHLKEDDRLFPWSLKERIFVIKKHPYRLKDGTEKERLSVQIVGTKRAWQIVNALLPDITQHWLRAFGYNWDYDHMDHDLLAVSDKTKADPRSLQPYLRRRYEKYPVS